VRQAWSVLEPTQPYVHGWHIDAICEHLEAVTEGEIIRLLINVPPGFSKSLTTAVFWPAWEWGPRNKPATRYLGSSYSETYATRDSRRMLMLVASEWYQERWGERVQLTKTGESRFENTAMGWREAVPFSRLTGGRGDRVILDDPHSTESADSEAERLRAVRTFREGVPTRLNNPDRSAIIVIMQRLHERDVSGEILANDLGYEHLMLPMEFEPERACHTILGFVDPRTEDGELLFPGRFPREVVDRDKKAMTPYAVAGQFQQRPAPREGGMFKRSWFPIVDAAPAVATRVRAWDLAASHLKGDWTAGVRMSRDAAGIFYVEHVERLRGEGNEVERSIVTLAGQDPKVTKVRLPQDPGQAGKSQAQYLVRQLAGHTVVVKPPTGSKTVRADPFASQAAASNVRLVRGPWNEAFLNEIEVFPAGAHDDQVDAAADAFNELAMHVPSVVVGTFQMVR
jgi:predicted phage terminase large subunit-like protein